MRIHRIYTDQALEPGRDAVLEDAPAHYLSRVLRVTTGQSVVLINGDGHEYPADVQRTGRREVVLAVRSRLPGLAESALEITVAQALSRGERMDQTLQKCTELGVAAFQPLFSERSAVRLAGEKLQRRLEHWQSVVISACEQCGRARVPAVLPPLPIADWLGQTSRASRLVLDPEAAMPLPDIPLSSSLELAVGPEGGFSAEELGRMRECGVQSASLGPRILRTETAAAAAVAILQCLKGDLSSQGWSWPPANRPLCPGS